MDHPFISPSKCDWRGIIIRFIYMFTILDIACPFIPESLDITLILDLKNWLSRDPGDYKPNPYHNGLKLFLWLITDCLNIYDEIR